MDASFLPMLRDAVRSGVVADVRIAGAVRIHDRAARDLMLAFVFGTPTTVLLLVLASPGVVSVWGEAGAAQVGTALVVLSITVMATLVVARRLRNRIEMPVAALLLGIAVALMSLVAR